VLSAAAGRYGIERGFLISVAAIENGPVVPSGEGMTRGLGVLPKEKYPTFEQQVIGSALTIANTVVRYEQNLGRSAYEGSHYSPSSSSIFRRRPRLSGVRARRRAERSDQPQREPRPQPHERLRGRGDGIGGGVTMAKHRAAFDSSACTCRWRRGC